MTNTLNLEPVPQPLEAESRLLADDQKPRLVTAGASHRFEEGEDASRNRLKANSKAAFIRRMRGGAGAIAVTAVLAACSSTPDSAGDIYDSSYSQGGDLASVKAEYNADLAELRGLLDSASEYEDRLQAMEPVDQYSQWEVDSYNELVNNYNDVANRYTFTASAFNEKYKAYAEGADGTVPTSPDNITLPDPIP